MINFIFSFAIDKYFSQIKMNLQQQNHLNCAVGKLNFWTEVFSKVETQPVELRPHNVND